MHLQDLGVLHSMPDVPKAGGQELVEEISICVTIFFFDEAGVIGVAN